jgi:single-strand DNA-binding protein|tara:strand:- start:3674 stop:4102 length:429 start_codon:yes stop_codon:yes gene_type:complete
MPSSVNKAIVLGNLGAYPELRHTASGTAVCELRVATNDRWQDKGGEWQERTEWHRVVVWGKQGENCARFLQKGRQVYVEGQIQTREWQDKDGNKRWTTEIKAREVVFLSGEGRSGPPEERSAPNTGADAPAETPFSDDEIPF